MMNKVVRESRHIWVGNLPENVREEQIQDYFSRFGRVEKVKLLTKSSPDGGKAAFVDFLDIRSATKANEAQNRMGDRDLRTNYNEPGGNKVQEFGRVPAVRTYGNYPPAPGIPYRGQPVVIYAAPPGNHLIRTAATYPIHPRDERKVIAPYQPRRDRGRSPVSRGSASDEEHSVSPTRRSRGTADYSSDSDASSGKFSKRSTIVVQNLVARNSDSSLEEALYYEFKKYGAILNIVIKGTGPDRHAYIKFMKPEAAEEAVGVTGKLFLGQEMKIILKGASAKRRSKGSVDLEFDPHATRTVFIGNLEKTTSHGELRGIFEHFGDVVDVDIKKMQTGLTTYAFIQYIDIDGAMRAKRKMDRQYIGQNRLKVGYGRGTPTNSLWVGNLPINVAEHQISKAFHPFGYVQRTLIDKQYWQALVRFETIEACTRAFAEMHGKQLLGKRLLVDYASPSCRDGFYARMERNGLLDRHQLEPSPTPPDAHINFQNPARAGGRFQPRGTYNSHSNTGPPFSPRGGSRDRDYENDRYSDRKSEYDKDLREYGAARDKYRSRRSVSRESLSPKRRRSRESFSPVSSVSFYGDRKVKVKKEKKRKRHADDSPTLNTDEPISKKKKKEKKKEKKDKAKKDKAVKGSIDLGYNINDDDEKSNMDVSPPTMKSKMEMKKEKKERKRLEKAEKERRKAEKKQKKLQKKKGAEDGNEANANPEDTDRSIVKSESNLQESTENSNVNDKPLDTISNSESNNIGSATSSEKVDGNGSVSEPTSGTITGNGTSDTSSVNVKIEPKTEEELNEESKSKDASENNEVKVNGSTTSTVTVKTEKDAVIATDNSNSISDSKEKDISNNMNTNQDKTNDKKVSNNKRRKSTGEKEKKVKLESTGETKDTSDSSSSSSSSSSDSDDSDDSSDDDDDKDAKHRPYRHAAKDRRKTSSISSHDKKDSNDSKSREPKAYRQGSLSDYPRDSLRDRSLDRDRDYKFKYNPEGRKSPSIVRRQTSLAGKIRGRSNSPMRRSPIVSERTRSRSPYERRRGRSPIRSKPSDRMDRKDNLHSRIDRDNRTPPPPHAPPKEIIPKPVELQQPLSYPPKPLTIGNPVYTTPTASGAENPDTLLDLLRRFPVMWQGLLGLKNDTAAVQMHFLSGNVNLAEQSLPRGAQPHDVPPPLRISQRMKLEPSQLEGVDKRIQHQKEHCMLLALPCGRDPLDVHAQTRALKTGFITYLQQKQAAGIINVPSATTKAASFVVHIFPPCDFAQGHLARVAPDLLNSAADSGHLMVLITPL